jgi:hypothetical protein
VYALRGRYSARLRHLITLRRVIDPGRELFDDVCRELMDAPAAQPAAAAAHGSDDGGSGAPPPPPPRLALLQPTPNRVSGWGENRDKFMVSPRASHGKALAAFRGLGVLIGAALRTGVRIPLALSSTFWKPLVEAPLGLPDLDAVDHYIAANTVGALRACASKEDFEARLAGSLTLSTTLSDGSPLAMVPDGGARQLTYDRREEFIEWLIAARLGEGAAQVAAVKAGLASVVPLEALRLLTGPELELAVCGRPAVDVEMLRRHTVLGAGIAEGAPCIRYFWEALTGFSDAERGRFIKFAWAQERLPTSDREYARAGVRLLLKGRGGVEGLPRAAVDAMLPRADTCFFNVELPPYSSLEACRRALSLAMSYGGALDGDNV